MAGELDGVCWPATVVRKVAHAGEDVHAELAVGTNLDQIERPGEVLLCSMVAAGVVGHPSGHLGERRGGREYELSVAVVIDSEQSRRYLGGKVLDDRGIQ